MLKVAQGNDISLCKRLMTWNGTQYVEVQAAEVTNLKVKYGTGTIASATELAYTVSGSIVHFRLESTQIAQLGKYNIWITGAYAGNDSSINMECAILVVPFSNQSNAQDYVTSEEQDLGDDIFIPVPLTSAEVEALKVQLQAAVQAANAAKAAYEALLAQISDVATETNATLNKTAILTAIGNLQGTNPAATMTAIYTLVGAIQPGLSNADKVWLLQQFAAIDLSSITTRLDNATYGLQALKTAISSITFDKSDLAKSAELELAKQAIIAAIPSVPTDYAKAGAVAKNLDDIQVDLSAVAKEAQATTNKQSILDAISAIVAGATQAQVQSIANALQVALQSNDTTATLGALKTLVAAIPTTQITGYALQGTNQNINLTTINSKMDTVIGTGITEITTQAITEIVNRVITEDSESE